MKRLITVVCLLVCVVLLCASCSKDMTMSEFYADYTHEESYLTIKTATELQDLSKLNYVKNLEEVIVFKNNDTENEKTKFYNAETGKFVLELPSDELTLCVSRTFYNNTFIVTVENDEVDEEITYAINLYDANGNKVASKEIEYSEYYFNVDDYIKSSSDFLKFDGKIYRVNKDGSASVVIDNPFFGNIPTNLTKTESYYYQLNDDEVTVYDHSLNEVLYWEIPYSSYDEASMFVLSTEKVLVQILNVLPETEKKYDFVDGDGAKYALASLLIDVTTGDEKELDLDFIVYGVSYSSNRIYSYDAYDFMNEKIDNLANICYIEDKKLLDSDPKYVALSGKKVKVEFEIAPELDNLPYPIASDRYYYSSNSGNYYLINGKGEVISKINGIDNVTNTNDNYIVIDSKIYDYELELVYDLEENKKELVKLMANGFIVKDSEGDADDHEYHLHTKAGAVIKIEDYYTSSSQYYATREYDSTNFTYKYSFFNDNGDVITTIDEVSGTPYVVYNYEDDAAILIAMEVDEKISYYKFSK